MNILPRYLTKEFFKLLFFCQTIFVTIYLIIDFLQKIDNFVEADAANAIFVYLSYKTPYITVQMVPVASLIAIILMFSLMKKNNEILFLKASGISIFHISLPVLCASLSVAAIVFLISELIVPITSSESQSVWNKEVKKITQKQFYGRDQIWYKGVNSIYWIKHFDGKRMIMEQPVFYFFDDSFHLIKRIQAKKAIWAKGKWKLQGGIIQIPLAGEGYSSHIFKEMEIVLPETPDCFLRPAKKPDEMSYWQLKRFAETIRLEGYDATRYLVDMNIKLAFPVINLVMALIGISIALGLDKGGTPLAISFGIGACFLYLVSFGLARSFGLSGILPPGLAAWFTNILFSLLGIYMMMNVRS